MSGFQDFTHFGASSAKLAPVGSPQSAAPRAGSPLARVWDGLRFAMRAVASRHDLAEMDDRMLKDLGISRAQAQFEASRAPWHLTPRNR